MLAVNSAAASPPSTGIQLAMSEAVRRRCLIEKRASSPRPTLRSRAEPRRYRKADGSNDNAKSRTKTVPELRCPSPPP